MVCSERKNILDKSPSGKLFYSQCPRERDRYLRDFALFNLSKLFVGGIHEDTTEEGLRNYFSSYGEVTDCVVMHEKENPKKSR